MLHLIFLQHLFNASINCFIIFPYPASTHILACIASRKQNIRIDDFIFNIVKVPENKIVERH